MAATETTASLPGTPVSPWLDGTLHPLRRPLERDPEVEVVVIGAGIVGLTTALELRRAGVRVAVLEGRRVGSGVSGNTTAKLSSLHGLTYSSLAAMHGAETAQIYGAANQWGIDQIESISAELQISCELRRKPNFTYTEDPERVEELRSEAETARAVGLPASFVERTDLPFEVAGAVRFDHQAEFHPVKYLLGIAAALERDGVAVCEQTRAVGLADGGVRTESGEEVGARRVIVATHLPFLDRGLFFARASVERSYALTVRMRGELPKGMYLQAESPGRSLRALPWGGDELLLIGGESHELGHGDPVEKFKALEQYAHDRFEVDSIEHRWDAHDYMPDDRLPYVGQLWPVSDRILTATGMRKWGLAMGTAAARMLADKVLGRDNDWASTFDPRRLPRLSSAPELLKHNADSGIHFFADRAKRGDSLVELAPGEGRVIGAGLRRKAVHRDRDGRLHAVSARCTHLGCLVRWNGAMGTWDCPCHGSRFEATGAVTNGPATAPLAAEQLPEDPD